MASIKKGKINGSIGNITYYTLLDREVMRIKPAKVVQTAATKQSGARFGKASSMTHALLNGMAAELDFKILPGNRGKTVAAVTKWLGGEGKSAVSSLHLFQPAQELNDQVSLEKLLPLQVDPVLAEDHTITVTIGAFNPVTALKVREKTEQIILKVLLVTLKSVQGDNDIRRYPVTITIPYDDAGVDEQVVSFPVQPEAGMSVLVGLAVSYQGYKFLGRENDRKWLPAAVLGIGKMY
jgi:hypothetical protein